MAYAARSGHAALNVVSAALDVDARTAGTPVSFARNPEELARALAVARAAGHAPVAAWSFYSTDFPRFARHLAALRREHPDLAALHVAGGVHATAEPRAVLEAGFDLVAVGEGESTAVELLTALAQGDDVHAVPGLAWLEAGRYRTSGPAARRPLDTYPAFNARFRRLNAIEITRGCAFACTFCQTPFAFKARFRHRSVANVREHVRAMVAGGTTYVRFVTPTALSYGCDGTGVDLAAVEALLAGVRAELGSAGRMFFGTFPSELRPEHVTPAALALIARHADNRSVVIGGQSGSDRVLAALRRGHSVADVERAVEHCVRASLRPDVDLLLGLPGEAPDDRRATLALAERLVARGARIHTHAFLPLPGTPLRDAEPAPIEEDVARGLGRLDALGQAFGPWRAQVVHARELLARRPPRA